jgi:S1-C subfamily serine protease
MEPERIGSGFDFTGRSLCRYIPDMRITCLIGRRMIFLIFVHFGMCALPIYGQGGPSADQIAKWRKAADQGDAVAFFSLGRCYEYGQGVAQDKTEAAKWNRKAAERGHAIAQYNLGVQYNEGNGVPEDAAEAAKWYRKAAEQGLGIAQNNLGACYSTGKGVTENAAEAVKWYRMAAEQGDATGQAKLGECYARGNGVVKNEVLAYLWFLLAAAQGIEVAKQNVSIIEEAITPDQRAEGQRLAQAWDVKHTDRGVGQKERTPQTESVGENPKVTGTGFFITRNGFLVTNHHVVKGCIKVCIQTAAGLSDAQIVRVDEASDLALLKVAGSFDALPIVSSRATKLGAMVATVGFPNIGLQGFEPKLSKGDLSSLAGIQDDVKQFQISVPIQPGNSGGALVDERGNVVGIVTAQLNQEAALANTGTLAQNVNYAVKSSYLLSFLEAVPEVNSGMLDANAKEQKFEAVVEGVKKATVLIIGY